MGDTLTLKAKQRDLSGPKPNALRAQGQIPAVIHDHGKDSHHITIDEPEMVRVFSHAGKHAPVELDVEGKKYTALIKEMTRKPATMKVYHTVFQAVKANEKVSAEIPIRLSDEIPAERASLMVVSALEHVTVEALPKDLIDEIIVDASSLEKAGDKLTVADIKAPSGVVITTDSEHLVASVETPKDQIAEADAAAAELAEADAGKPEAEADADAEATEKNES